MREEEGATAVEYGLIISLIFLIILSAVTQFGEAAKAMWDNIAIHISNPG